MSARKKWHRGKYLNRGDQPRTDQTNNPVNHGNGVPADAAVKQQPLRLGQVSLVPSARSTEGPPSESRKARALQQFGPSHAQADELGAAKLSRTLSASTSAFSRAQPTRTPIWKVVVVLFITMGIVALARMKESPLLNFGWRESDRTAASASLSLQDRALHGGPSLRLAIQEVRGISGEPLPLGTSLEGVTNHAVVIVRGLVAGMTLSTGSAFGANAWRVPASEFADAWIGPPKDFSGVVDVTAELYLPDQTVADRRRLRLVWSAPPALPSEDPASSPEPAALARSAHQAAPRLVDGPANSPTRTPGADATLSAPLEAGANPVSASADPTVIVQSPSVSTPPAQAGPVVIVASALPSVVAPGVADPPASLAIPRTLQLDREQIAILVERGKALIASGDLAAARVVLRRAAEAKDAVTALALGSTYDPIILRELKAVGFAPDLELARRWYEKAKEFGSEEAQRRIQILARLGGNRM